MKSGMSLRDHSVLLTAGSGFIGSHHVDRLITEAPRKIVFVDSFFLGGESNLADARCAYPDLGVLRLDASDLASMHDVVVEHAIETVGSGARFGDRFDPTHDSAQARTANTGLQRAGPSN